MALLPTRQATLAGHTAQRVQYWAEECTSVLGAMLDTCMGPLHTRLEAYSDLGGSPDMVRTQVASTGKVLCCRLNHLEERLLDQAQARASYTPPFGGHSRSIPQGMILDVQPLVKSLFCPIRPSPNGFFDSEASIP